MRWLPRALAVTAVLGAALAAYAIGNGDIRANPEVTVITITSATGSGSGTAALENTSAMSYTVLVGSDATCDPALMFAVSGGNPVAISPSTMRSVQLSCPARGVPAMRRCVYHATNNANGNALADFMTVCLYGSSATLTPQQTTLDFGTVTVGDSAMLDLELQHDGSAAPITRIYLQTSDLAGNFQFSTPCNPDAAYCDADVASVAQGGTLALQIRCTPQSAGVHTAQLYVGTDTFQLLAQPVTLECTGSSAAAPVLSVSPTNVVVQAPVEVMDGSANAVVHLTNAGAGTLLVNDVRTVDVDTGAALDWTYTASGECTGTITNSCSLDAGETVDINLTFDPSALGRRRATLLVSYDDSIHRTKEILLEASGLGGTLDLVGGDTSLTFGSVPVGKSSTLDIVLGNRGNRDVNADVALAPPSSPPFTLSPATTLVVSPGVDETLSVTCAPTSAGAFTTTLSAQASDGLGATPLSVAATCEGSTLALYANPTAIALGEIRVGGGTFTRTIQLLGASGSPLTLVGQPMLVTATAGVTLGALSQQTTPASFDITFDPSLMSAGQLALQIEVVDDDDETLAIPITGRVVEASYEVSKTLDLGTFCVGQPTTPSNAALVSDGTARIRIMQPTLGSTSAFQLANASPSTYPIALVPAATATVSVTPLRQSAVAQLSDTLTWHTDVEGAPTATTDLSARFIDQGGAIAPPALNFGEVTVHLYSEDGQRVMIQNCNPTPLVLDPPMIKTPFEIDSPNFPTMLNPNETTTFSVGFHPTRIGVVTDTLRITSPQLPGAPLEVTLVGEGTAPDEVRPDAGVGGGKDDTSFYACSCRSSRPGGALPVVLAVLCALLPRRRASLSQRPRARADRIL